jgi:hypothetical protein
MDINVYFQLDKLDAHSISIRVTFLTPIENLSDFAMTWLT